MPEENCRLAKNNMGIIEELHHEIMKLDQRLNEFSTIGNGNIIKITELEKENKKIHDLHLFDLERIEKLEKERNWDVINAQWESFQKDLEEHEQMFSELKVRSAAHTEENVRRVADVLRLDGTLKELKVRSAAHTEDINNNTELTRAFNQKRVNEIFHLQEWFKDLKTWCEQLEKVDLDHIRERGKLNKEIKELKERVEGIYKSVHGIAPNEPDVIKEVLRELIIFQRERKQLKFTYEEIVNQYREFEDKLGGSAGSSRQTGKCPECGRDLSVLMELSGEGEGYCSKCHGVIQNSPSEQDSTDDSKVYHEDQGTSARQTEVRLGGGSYTETSYKEKEPTESIYFCDICGNEISQVEYEVANLSINVEKADLEWIFDTFELYMDFEADWSEEKQHKRIGLKEKYLKEDTK